MYEELIRTRRIRRHRATQDEIRRILGRAQRDVQTAETIMAIDWDWAFAVGYNAVLQASRAFMFRKGFRPASAEAHKNTFAFMREALGAEHEDLITYFDRMRAKRNQAVYDVAGIISETEAKGLLRRANGFVAFIADQLSLP